MKKNIYLILFFLLPFMAIISFAQENNSIKYLGGEIKNSKLYKKGNIYQKDFLLFTEMLQESHPAFSPSVKHPFSIKKVEKEGYKWSEKCTSKKEFSAYIQAILTRLEDGHSLVKADYDYNQIYPFSFFIEDGGYYLQLIDKRYEQYLGEEIISINNATMDEVFTGFKKIISSENEHRFVAQLQQQISFYSLWENTPYLRDDHSLELKFKSGKSATLYPIAQKSLQMSSMQPKIMPKTKKTEIERTKTKAPFHYSLYETRRLCFLQFDKCNDKRSLISYYQNMGLSQQEIEQRTAAIPDFSLFLDSMFVDMNKNNITTLVIDVRYNLGGNSMLANELLSRLKSKNQIKQGTAEVRLSGLWELNYPQLAESYREKTKANNIPYTIGKLYSNDEINTLLGMEPSGNEAINSSKEQDYFKGKVFFLQGPNTYSSAGMLITNAIDNNIGEVIGCKSTFAPCSYGDMLTWALPNTGINGYLSHKVFVRPNKEKCHEKYITPQVEVSPYSLFLHGYNAHLEWIVDNIQ